MPWLVRHEGSPRSAEQPTAQAVLDGLRDGDWEPTDEVRGPGEAGWTRLEAHPQFAEAVEDLEQSPRVEVDDSRLDMNPLIDVALVLLIFFILTASYSSLRRAIELPAPPPDEQKGRAVQPVVTEKDVEAASFRFRVWVEDGRTLYKLEDRALLADEIERGIADHVRANPARKELLLDVGPGVALEDMVRVCDAAKAADLHRINRVYRKGRG